MAAEILDQLRELLGEKGVREEPHPSWPDIVLNPNKISTADKVA